MRSVVARDRRRSRHVRRPHRRRLAPLLLSVCLLATATAVAAAQTGVSDEATQRLFAAVQSNDFAAVQQAIAAGADVEARSPWGITAAEMAVDKGYYRIAHYLVSVRHFQRPREAAATGTPGAAAAAPTPGLSPGLLPGGMTGGEAGARAALGAAGGAPATAGGLRAQPPALPAPATPTAAPPAGPGNPDPFDPARPAYGSRPPGSDGRGS